MSQRRVILAMTVPADQHGMLIGRGGEHIKALRERFDVSIEVGLNRPRPGNAMGAPSNPDAVQGVDPADIVKIRGLPDACEQAMAVIAARFGPPKQVTVPVPAKYDGIIALLSFLRSLKRSGVSVSREDSRTDVTEPPLGFEGVHTNKPNRGSSISRWEVEPIDHSSREGIREWKLESADADALLQAQERIADAIKWASGLTHVGCLTLLNLPSNKAYGEIIGERGKGLEELCETTRTAIWISREHGSIIIVGKKADIEKAREAILRLETLQNLQARHDGRAPSSKVKNAMKRQGRPLKPQKSKHTGRRSPAPDMDDLGKFIVREVDRMGAEKLEKAEGHRD